MAREMKVRTRTQEGQVEILVLVNHPMETGLRKDKASGNPIPAHFIQNLVLELNGQVIADVQMGIGVSENPLIGFRSATAKNGDRLKASWKDNRGESGSMEAVVDVS